MYPPKTNMAPENGWLENYSFLLGWLPDTMLVSGSVDLKFLETCFLSRNGKLVDWDPKGIPK